MGDFLFIWKIIVLSLILLILCCQGLKIASTLSWYRSCLWILIFDVSFAANSYARAYESLKSVCSDLDLKAPHQITSVSMRKYTATLTQV